MNSITISKLEKEPVVCFSGKVVVLPEKIQQKIDAYWQSLLDSGKSYTRGEVFTVTEEGEIDGTLNVLVEKTDYAHYLYCQNIDTDLDGYGIRVIFTACLVETADDKLIFGKMGGHTARAGIFQLAGGGIDNHDLFGDRFDLLGNISKELHEELNINIKDNNRVREFHAAYLKQGSDTNKIAVVYRIILTETAEEFLEKYGMFAKGLNEKSQSPEFSDIVVIERSKNGVESFFMKNGSKCDEYMFPLFQYAYLS